jgi:hypothetical protein
MFNATQKVIQVKNELAFTSNTPEVGCTEGELLTLKVNGVPLSADEDV